ncbi:cysteine hydrolase [Lentilactobacillus senioris]|uniref:cysteine hydrolase family protein n=1 Tax=Lentilactobacillus senioris TaxID=931534 RepID=UPI0022827D2A|nr:isochorismatase family cysteine hydrolase [Lentilactobacillus senioris]MCY9807241.1 cysteine hydrolase [Lentilactobacillus senioris]
MQSAVLVIDMTNDFLTGKLKNDRALKTIQPINDLVNKARKKSVPVIYVSDAHYSADHELKIWGEHSMKGTWGSQITTELTPQDGDYSLEKRTYSAFFETGLDSLLRELNVDNLILTGVVTNICIQHSAADACLRGYEITVPTETTEALNDKDYKHALNYIKTMYGGKIISSTELL